jgi:hypothetical protein
MDDDWDEFPAVQQPAAERDEWAKFPPVEASAEPRPAADDEWAAFPPVKTDQPEAEGGVSTFLRHAVHALPATAVGLGVGALRGIPAGPGGMLVSAALGGGAAFGESYLQNKALEKYWPEEAERLRRGAEEHPYLATAGAAAATAPFLTTGGLTAQAIKQTAGQRVLSGGVQGGLDAGLQYALTGQIDPGQTAIQTGAGALFGGPPTALGRKIGLIPHGTPGSPAAAGTVHESAKPLEEPGIGNPQSAPERSERDYPTERQEGAPSAAATAGVNVGEMDPTLGPALRGEPIQEPAARAPEPVAEPVAEPPARQPEPAAEAATRAPDETLRSPSPEAAPRPAVEAPNPKAVQEQAFIEALAKGPEATAEHARATGMSDEQVRAQIYERGDSNPTSEARYQRYLAAKEALPPPTTREAVAPSAAALRGGYHDTRGQGLQFHGAPSEVALAEGHYGSSGSYYGTHSLYTTDALDAAHGYANKRNAKAPSIYEVIPLRDGKPTRDVKIYDMEAPISPELRGKIDEVINDRYAGDVGGVAEDALAGKPKNLREFFDEAREAAGGHVPADEVQEGLFHPLMDYLSAQGYHGMSHRGGLRTKTPEHKVVVYFDADKNVKLRKMSEGELAGLRKAAPAAKEAPPTAREAIEQRAPGQTVDEALKARTAAAERARDDTISSEPIAGGAGGGAGKPPVPPVPPAGGAAGAGGGGGPQPGNVAAAQAAVFGRVAAPKPSLLSRIPTNWAEAKTAWRAIYTAAKNDLDPLEQVTKRLAQGRPLSAEEDPNVLARLTRGNWGRVEQQLKYGTFDIKTGTTNGKALQQVLEPVKDNVDGFKAYAIAKRAIELEGRGVKTGVPLPEANTVVAAGAKNYEPVFRELVAYQDRVLDNLQKSGILSAADVLKMRQLNKEYVPYYRMMDPNSELGQQLGVGGGLQVKDPVRGIKGSGREILDPIDSIIKNTYAFTALAERNLTMQALEDLAATHPQGKTFMQRVRDVHPTTVSPEEINRFMQQHGVPTSITDAMTVFRPNAFRPSADEIRLFRDGKSLVYKVADPTLAKAVNAMDREGMNMLTRILAKPAQLLRAGATLSPEFIARNPIRDQFSAYAFSKYGYVPVYDMVRAVGNILRKDNIYQSWLKAGGANATLVSLDRRLIGLDANDFAGRVQNVIKSPIEALRTVSELMENATRLGEFRRGIESGASPKEAAFASREVTLDFARTGAKTRALNAIIPFFNAQVEGVDRAARAFRDNPGTFLTKVAASITAPSVLFWLANKDDQRYQELPQWQKDLFWIVPTDHWVGMSAEDASKVGTAFKRQLPNGQWQRNDGTIYRIPKPFELGVLFGSVPERALNAFYGTNPHPFKDLHKSVQQALLPNFLPQAATPVIEQFANRSTFLDRPLVPKSLEGVAPKYQFTPQTSEVAKTLGSIISSFNPKTSFASPIVIDNYIKQYTGGLGGYVVDAMDKLIAPSGTPAKPASAAADTYGLRAFAARFPSSGAQSIEDFYDTYAERKQAKTTSSYLRKHGQADASIEQESPAESIHKQIGRLSKKVQEVYEDKQLTPQRKREIIDTTYLQMIETARRGNEFFERTRKRPAA